MRKSKKKQKQAFVTGITGQDGSYLAELLIRKKYIVHGVIRRSSSFNRERIQHLYQDSHGRGSKLILILKKLAWKKEYNAKNYGKFRWKEKRVIVTGRKGFLGRHLVEKLKQEKALKLLNNGYKYSEMRKKAIAWSKNFTWEKSGRQSLEFIESI